MSLSHHPGKEPLQHHSRCVPRAQASGDVSLLKLFPGRWPGADIVLAGAGPCLRAQGEGEDGKRRKVSFAHSPAYALAKAQLAQSLAHMTCGNKVLQTWIKCSDSH